MLCRRLAVNVKMTIAYGSLNEWKIKTNFDTKSRFLGTI